jgi:hypothetical protein
MKIRLKYLLWVIPLLAILVTIIYARVFFSGVVEPWRLVGKPSENIARIIGVKFTEGKLYVSSASGHTYSLYFLQYIYRSSPLPAQWMTENEKINSSDPVQNYGGEKFTPPPPPFLPIQLFEFGIPAVESTSDMRFALSEDGNLWCWSFGTGVYQGFFIGLVLVIEILAFLLSLFVYLIVYLIKRVRKNRTGKPQYFSK